MGLFGKKSDDKLLESKKVPRSLPDTAMDAGSDISFKNKKDFGDSKKIHPGIADEKPEKMKNPGLTRVPFIIKREKDSGQTNSSEDHDGDSDVAVNDLFDKSPNVLSSSFFSKLRDNIEDKDSGRFNKDINSKNVVGKMKDFHESLRSKSDFLLHEKDIDSRINSKVDELKVLENNWLVSVKKFESAERDLLDRELEVENKLEELKKLMSAADRHRVLYKACDAGSEFITVDGEVLHSLQELLYVLPHMSEASFRHHVNSERNDFYSWTRDVFNNSELAEYILKADSRSELIDVLKSI